MQMNNLKKNLSESYPGVSFLFVTRNRCPNKDFKKNPLTWAFQTLLANSFSSKLSEWIVISDGSSDYTRENIKWLSKIYNIDIKTKYYKNRKGCSYRRRQGIRLLKNELFFMGDDDCLFKQDFIKNSLYAWNNLSLKYPKLAVIALPVLEMRTTFNGRINKSKVGLIDFKKAWFYHNFDKEVIYGNKAVQKPFRIYTFTGVTLGNKNAFIDSGNFPDLSSWGNDYSEHLEVSYQLDQHGYRMYYLPDIHAGVTHIKWGDLRKILPKEEKNIIFPGIRYALYEIEKESRSSGNSGCRISSEEFIINRIGSFLSFYVRVNPKSAYKYALHEFMSIIDNNQVIGTPEDITHLSTEKRVNLWKIGVYRGVEYAEKISRRSYGAFYDKLIDKAKREYAF